MVETDVWFVPRPHPYPVNVYAILFHLDSPVERTVLGHGQRLFAHGSQGRDVDDSANRGGVDHTGGDNLDAARYRDGYRKTGVEVARDRQAHAVGVAGDRSRGDSHLGGIGVDVLEQEFTASYGLVAKLCGVTGTSDLTFAEVIDRFEVVVVTIGGAD